MIFTDYMAFLFYEDVTLDTLTGIKKNYPTLRENYFKLLILNLLTLLFLKFIVNGNFSEWSKWTSCSVSCSQGVRTRERTCTNPSPANGTDCIGNYTDRIVCKEGPCPGITKLFCCWQTLL